LVIAPLFKTTFAKVAIQDFILKIMPVLKYQFYAMETIHQLELVWVVLMVTLLSTVTVSI